MPKVDLYHVHVYKVNDCSGGVIFVYDSRDMACVAANVFFLSLDVYKVYVFYKEKKIIECI